jgi:hypothetical protein
MKNLFLIAIMVAAMISCNGNKNSNASEASNSEQTVTTDDFPVLPLDSLLKVADTELDKTVKVTGYVTHTCKHSGKRCFIVGESQTASMRIEAKGEIGGFNRELVGSKIEVTGTLKERRLTKEYIDQMEKDVDLKKEEDGAAESCAAELSNINDMRKWMKDNNKEYYSIYYMDGHNYTVLE